VNSRSGCLVALISVTLISLEIAWTRIFSAEFFYTFAFLILSLAILGLGLGALALRLVPSLDREPVLGPVLSLTGLMSIIGPPLVFLIDPRMAFLFRDWASIGKFALTVLILSAPYFFGGIALARIFKSGHRRLPRLYMADLIGAGVGVAVVIPVMNAVGTPVATFYCAVPVLLAALMAGRRAWRLVPLVLGAAMIMLGTQGDSLLQRGREEHAPIGYTHWDAVAKIKIYDYEEPFKRINIDNMANSPVYGFDGNWDVPDSMRFEFGIDVKHLIDLSDSCTFLSLGSGGGVDVLQALQWGATDIHAVEVVPHVNALMTTGALADFTGRIYDDPRVTVVTEDARAYVRRHRDTFDVIYSLSSNTFAAMASGAFAMAENYLFTTEAFEDYWRALSPSGFMMMEHQFYMPRLVSELVDALEAQSVDDPTAHFAVYDLPSMRRNMLLISKRPLTDEIRNNAFGELTPELFEHIHLLYPAADSLQDNLINRIVLNGWEAEAESSAVALSPCTDDRPYTGQMGLWRNLTRESLDQVVHYEISGFPLSKLLLAMITVVVLVLIIPLNLLPYVTKGEKLKAVPWIYFFLVGMAYIGIEIVLIQRYTCFIGTTIASIATVLLTLLIMSGLGSRVAARTKDRVVFGGIVLWLIIEVVALKPLTVVLGGLTLWPRILASAIMIAPAGFLMGMPFPKGGLRVGPLVDWGFAVNGAASVLGSVVALFLAFNFGFGAALLVAAAFYALAYLLYSARLAW